MREPKPETRLERQGRQSAAEALGELPVHCDVGTKRNSKGHRASWIGYKLHADVNDCGLPISVALTAASLHDSQVAIPLMKLTSERVDYLYDLMDAAYDAKPIYEVSRSLGHVPIIDKNGRGRDGHSLVASSGGPLPGADGVGTFQRPPERRVRGWQRHGAGGPESRASPHVWRDRPVRRPVAQADQLSISRLDGVR